MSDPPLTPRLDPRNANKGTDEGRSALRQSLDRLGPGRSILLDKNGVAIAGNKTLEQAQALNIPVEFVETDGDRLIAVVRKDLSLYGEDPKARELAIADNRVAELDLEWDAEVLADLSTEVDLDWLFDEPIWEVEIDDDLPEEDPEDLEKILGEDKIESRVNLGQIWACGRHRVACCDSTNLDSVKQLFSGQFGSVELTWTDPPYGVSYSGRTKKRQNIKNDSLSASGLEHFLCSVFEIVALAMGGSGSVYVAHPPGELHVVFARSLQSSGIQIKQTLIWVKNYMILSRLDYHYQHEPIYYCGVGNNKASRMSGPGGWHGGHDAKSVFFC